MAESHRDTVLLEGNIKGMGYESSCLLQVDMVTLPSLNVWEYVMCNVLQAPQELPDGSYEARFEGRVMQLKKLNGEWLEGGV
jgi:hypothetical protein